MLVPPLEVPHLEVHLGRISLVSAPEMGWTPEESSRFMDVHLGSPEDPKVGEVEISYDYDIRRARLHTELDVRKGGIGTELYTAVPFLPLPGGENFLDSGFRLWTNGHNAAANGFWESLVRNGLARPIDRSKRQYEMLPSIGPPKHISIAHSRDMLRSI